MYFSSSSLIYINNYYINYQLIEYFILSDLMKISNNNETFIHFLYYIKIYLNIVNVTKKFYFY